MSGNITPWYSMSKFFVIIKPSWCFYLIDLTGKVGKVIPCGDVNVILWFIPLLVMSSSLWSDRLIDLIFIRKILRIFQDPF